MEQTVHWNPYHVSKKSHDIKMNNGLCKREFFIICIAILTVTVMIWMIFSFIVLNRQTIWFLKYIVIVNFECLTMSITKSILWHVLKRYSSCKDFIPRYLFHWTSIDCYDHCPIILVTYRSSPPSKNHYFGGFLKIFSCFKENFEIIVFIVHKRKDILYVR